MLALLQRVSSAKVEVEGTVRGSIGPGLLVFLGIGEQDSEQEGEYLARRLSNLRIFNDSQGKMNLSLLDIRGEMLIISQFTLHADTRKGNRPSFVRAMPPDRARPMYLRFIEQVSSHGIRTAEGVFGAHMKITAENDGPVTIMLKSRNER